MMMKRHCAHVISTNSNMTVLHICGDFILSKVHISLFSELDNLGIKQIVYVPVNYSNRNRKKTEYNFKVNGSRIIYSKPLKKLHRFLYGLKISSLVRELESLIDVSDVDIIHSSLLCNEGAVAYELSRKYNKKFISSVRNTDMNDYFRIFKWRIPYFKKIAKAAERLVFISPTYKDRFCQLFDNQLRNILSEKSNVVYNGVDPYYLQNQSRPNSLIANPVRIVTAGAFLPNKNLHGLILAADILKKRGIDLRLCLIGNNLATNNSNENYSKRILEMAKSRNWVEVLDAQPKEKLCEIYIQSDIFALISFHETFGLSYVEALSQGLPIVYTKGEGFDNVFNDGYVGKPAIADNPESIADSISDVISNYDQMTENIAKIDFEQFAWNAIAKRYKQLYLSLL